MTTNPLENLWQMYPASHIHCDVAKAGQHSYRILASLIDSEHKVLGMVEHFGSGNLNKLKEEAFERLAEKMQATIET